MKILNINSKTLTLLSVIFFLSSIAGNTYAAPLSYQEPVDLGSASEFVILTQTGITNVSSSFIIGDVGTSPITGAALLLSCSEVIGNIFTVDAAGPAPCSIIAPALLSVAVGDMGSAYVDAAGRTLPDTNELGAGEIGGQTIFAGLHKWSSSVLISSDVILSGGPDDVWVFQIAGTLNLATNTNVILADGALAKNVFWQVAEAVTIGTYSHFEGVVLAQTMVAVNTGAFVRGRLLAQAAVTLQIGNVTEPTDPSPIVKHVDKTRAIVGDTLLYTLTNTYTGSRLLNDVTVTDNVPDGSTFVSANLGAMNDAGVVTWSLGSNTEGTPSSDNAGGLPLNQWATSVVAFSSEYTAGDGFDSEEALGEPDVNSCGDNVNAWTPGEGVTDQDFLHLGYGTSVYATQVRVHEVGERNQTVGFVTGVTLYEPDGTEHIIYDSIENIPAGSDPVDDNTACPGFFTLTFPKTTYLVNQVRIETVVRDGGFWENIDAVELIGSETPPLTTTTGLAATPTMSGDDQPITVTMSLTADAAVTNIVPSALSIVGQTNGANADACALASGANPGSIPAGGGSIDYTYSCNADTSGVTTIPSSLSFAASATASDVNFATATSNSVLMMPPLTMSVLVNSVTDNLLVNTAFIEDGGLIATLTVPEVCYAVADNGGSGNDDAFYTINTIPATWVWTDVGDMNVDGIEAITMSADGTILYAADEGRWGAVNTNTGNYTNIGSFGTAGGVDGNITLSDVDSLAVEIVVDTTGTGSVTGIYYGVHRRSNVEDILFQIDPATGAHIELAMAGGSADYVTIQTLAAPFFLENINDIAIDPETGEMYGIANNGGPDRLVLINKSTGAVTDIGVMAAGENMDMESLSFWGDQLVGTTGESGSVQDDTFYLINEGTGALTEVGESSGNDSDFEGSNCPTTFSFTTAPQVISASSEVVETAFGIDDGDLPITYGNPTHLLKDHNFGNNTSPLMLGTMVDDDLVHLADINLTGIAQGDDVVGNATDDEDGVVFSFPAGLGLTEIVATVTVTNTPGQTAFVCGWLDVFDGSGTRSGALSAQSNGNVCEPITGSGTLDFEWTGLPSVNTFSYARFRVCSTLAECNTPNAVRSSDGETEGYRIVFNPTLATIGNVDLRAISVPDFLEQLGADRVNNQALLNILNAFDPALAALTADDRNAILAAFQHYLDPDGDGQVAMLQWDTLEERGTVGFYVERAEADDGWVLINKEMLPAMVFAPFGAEYQLVDPGAKGGQIYQYRLIELEARGNTLEYGPFTVELK